MARREVPATEALNHALLLAAAHGDCLSVKKCLEAGADPNDRGKYGHSALMCAARRSDHSMVELLMRYGADPRTVSADGMFPMATAAVMCRPDIMDAMGVFCWDIESPSGESCCALEMALISGRLDAARHLARHGADLLSVCAGGQSLLMRMLIVNQEDAVALLLDEGAAWHWTDANGFSALDYAFALGRRRSLALLHDRAMTWPIIEPGRFLPKPGRPGIASARLRHILARQQAHRSSSRAGATAGSEPAADDALQFWSFDENTRASCPREGIADAVARVRYLAAACWQACRDGNAWLARPRRHALARTRAVIESLSTGDLEAAHAAFRGGPVFANAHDHTGTPLVVLAARALNMQPASTEESRRNCLSDRQRLALEILRDLALAGAHESACDSESGASVAHTLLAGTHSRVYLALLAERLYGRTLNQSNLRLDRPIHIAIRRKDYGALDGLLARGCDRNPVNKDGYSPLHLCAIDLDLELAETLIHAGANVRLRTRDGRTIESILQQHHCDTSAFSALVSYSIAISRAMSIFSPDNPLSSIARSMGHVDTAGNGQNT